MKKNIRNGRHGVSFAEGGLGLEDKALVGLLKWYISSNCGWAL
jgi:hypothetical protein